MTRPISSVSVPISLARVCTHFPFVGCLDTHVLVNMKCIDQLAPATNVRRRQLQILRSRYLHVILTFAHTSAPRCFWRLGGPVEEGTCCVANWRSH